MSRYDPFLSARPRFMPQKNNQTVQDALAESESPDPESGSDEDHEIEPEQPVLESESEFAADVGPAEHDYMLSEGLADIPDESVVDTESSDGRGLGFEDESDGDHEKDEDHVMDSGNGDKGSDLDSDGEFDLREVREPTKKPGKAKAAKVSCLFHLSEFFQNS
jgi:hypothetical protein